jgi:hypothetical protein
MNYSRQKYRHERDLRARANSKGHMAAFAAMHPAAMAELRRGEAASPFYRDLLRQVGNRGELTACQLQTVMRNVEE